MHLVKIMPGSPLMALLPTEHPNAICVYTSLIQLKCNLNKLLVNIMRSTGKIKTISHLNQYQS